MLVMQNKKVWILIILLFLAGCGSNDEEDATTGRWYKQSQVTSGKKVFIDNCASCHGASAQGLYDWRQPLSDGSYPPPPLNGSAHSWHHPLKMLKRTINQGTQQMGGSMPAFKKKLSDEQIEEAIAFFQSKWSDRVYNNWKKRSGLK